MSRRRFLIANQTKSPLPSGYALLDYIESTGTQYIDTGFSPNQDTRVVCDFQFTILPDGHWGIFGARVNSNATSPQYCFGYTNKTIFRTDYYQTRSPYQANAFDAVGRHVVDKNKNVTSLDGTIINHTYANFNIACNIVMFAINTGGAVANKSKLRMYSCQIYNNGTLVRDYLPCIDPSGAVGMYDLVSQKFYGNADTGTFVAGYKEVA